MNLLEIANAHIQASIKGRYITNEHILPFLENLPKKFHLTIEDKSVQNRNIYSVKIGEGATKIFIWSQMHGNESTTTKAVIDFIGFLNSDDVIVSSILKDFTFYILPILNPDGAKAYTRVNANQVDLNRDSVDLSQPESLLLRKCFDAFKPDFAFNMHDQRTLFAAGDENNPATISFLAPAFNPQTDINEVRTTAIQVICEMVDEVSKYIPNQIGRFDDSFNINCIGDCFTYLGVPTILFEAGHYPEDYEREETRKIVFISLLQAIISIQNSNYKNRKIEDYFKISENKKTINDILLKNIKVINDNSLIVQNLGIQYQEELKNDKIVFFPIFDAELIKNHQFGHLEIDASDYEINTTANIYDLLNKMQLQMAENGTFSVKYLLKY